MTGKPDCTGYPERLSRLVRDLDQRKLDGLAVSFGPNIRYLTGFTGSNAALLVPAAGEAVLFTDPRYRLQAAEEAVCPVRVARGPLMLQLVKAARRRKIRRLGFEKGRLHYADYELLEDNLSIGASLEPVAGLVETQRMVKSQEEIAAIRQAVRTTSKAYERAIRKVRPGIREADLAAELEYQMRLLGADKAAFDTIVAFGERTALPHARPAGNRLSANQLLLIDVGASQNGYASDMTRMAFLGSPGRKLRRLYEAVAESQMAALEAVRPGVTAAAVDRAARRALRARGLERAFVHSTGHGLGLEIHEPPRLGKRDVTRLVPGMVITVEPGAYLEGLGGVRIEDTLVVTSNGCEVLTPTPKELLLL